MILVCTKQCLNYLYNILNLLLIFEILQWNIFQFVKMFGQIPTPRTFLTFSPYAVIWADLHGPGFTVLSIEVNFPNRTRCRWAQANIRISSSRFLYLNYLSRHINSLDRFHIHAARLLTLLNRLLLNKDEQLCFKTTWNLCRSLKRNALNAPEISAQR